MNTTVVVIVIAAAVVALGSLALYLNYKTRRLRSKFGPEYTRAVEESGGRYRAEAKLERLERRVEKLSIHPPTREEADRFRESWRAIQAKFVDDPRAALNDADRLVGEVMSACGYPVADFEERAQEISVHHAPVVQHYRAGHEIAVRHAQGRATTEDMRLAMIHYRTLFDDLVGAPETVRVRGAGNSR